MLTFTKNRLCNRPNRPRDPILRDYMTAIGVTWPEPDPSRPDDDGSESSEDMEEEEESESSDEADDPVLGMEEVGKEGGDLFLLEQVVVNNYMVGELDSEWLNIHVLPSGDHYPVCPADAAATAAEAPAKSPTSTPVPSSPVVTPPPRLPVIPTVSPSPIPGPVAWL